MLPPAVVLLISLLPPVPELVGGFDGVFVPSAVTVQVVLTVVVVVVAAVLSIIRFFILWYIYKNMW